MLFTRGQDPDDYRELTWESLVLGVLQGIILNIAFVYTALKLGFSIGGSTVAAIMGYAFLRGLLRKGTSIENNINQTIASGINTAGTGVVFTLPALYILQAQWPDLTFSLWPFIIAGIAGSLLGVVVIVPLRKQMIELDRLRFPSGVAVTTIIRSGVSGDMSKAKLLGIGFAISAAWKLLMVSGLIDVPGVLENEELHFGFGLIPAYLSPVLYLSMMNIAAGLLAGKGGLSFFLGGMIAWWFISPLSLSLGWVPSGTESEQASFIYSSMLRPLGIGILIGGAIMGVVVSFPAIKSALISLIQATKTAKAGAEENDEMPFPVILIGAVVALILFFASSYSSEGVTLAQALAVSVVGTIWLGLAALIVAQATGMTDISPMSGMSLITITIMMFLLDHNVGAALVVGLAVSVAAGQAADMMQDMKTGFMLGAKPFKQQIVQLMVTWLGVIVAIGTVAILWKGGPGGEGGFGPGTAIPAPQAGVLSGIIKGLKTGDIPLDKYLLGGGAGILLTASPLSGLGVLIGLAMYLPFSITLGYGIGCLIQMYLEKKKGLAFCEHKLVPFAAGLIIGEAIMGIGHAGFQILVGSS